MYIHENLGNPSIRKRHRILVDMVSGQPTTELYKKEIPRPKMVEDYHNNMGTVDQGNMKRQGNIAFHYGWPTKTWWLLIR